MTDREAVNWLINIMADIGKAEHRGLWHYEQALLEIREMLEAQSEQHYDEWCTDCKEYDRERHCCPRWNRVIRETLNDAHQERKMARWIPRGCGCFECDECGERVTLNAYTAEKASDRFRFCYHCGARMLEGEQE